MFPLYVRVCVGTSPKYLTLARLNVILVRALLILSIILTGCGVSGVSAYAGTSNPTRTNTRESRSSTKQERSTGNRKILPATGQEPEWLSGSAAGPVAALAARRRRGDVSLVGPKMVSAP